MHTQLKIVGQGGPVEHTRGKEVRVVPKAKKWWQGRRQKNKKMAGRNVWKKKVNCFGHIP